MPKGQVWAIRIGSILLALVLGGIILLAISVRLFTANISALVEKLG